MDGVNALLHKKPSFLEGTPIFVMGNEAADLDSIVCCILYALFEFHVNNLSTIPIVNIPRAEFIFRAEVVWLFKQLNVDLRLITFIDEVDLGEFLQGGRGSLCLVDHNKLCPTQTDFGDSVKSIIDHHVDERQYSCELLRIIRPVGSCATLVAELLLQSSFPSSLLTPDLCKLALAPILVDTVNLDPAHHKVTPADETAAQQLLALIVGVDEAKQREFRSAFFSDLQREKYNTAHLSVMDSLRRDFKAFNFNGNAVGIPSILDSVEDLMAKEPANFFAICDAFAQQQKVSSLILMCAYFAGEEFRRQLVVLQPEPADPAVVGPLFRTLTAGLEGHPELGLSTLPCPLCGLPIQPAVRLYNMANTAFSRKKFAPLVASFFDTPQL